ncbi:ArsR/SmtB family transcription factor [Sphingoaurantiacus capsulatus]|uniref:ArsR/SmtB family transcription factor n=1 Tax=Sphingoaurantiacus capsulatus TaxID=1771310 RepID=A0ABV7X4D8_9SPHN
MTNIASLASIAALIGEPARTVMLVTLMDGRALTAGELAGAAGVNAPTASGHLGHLLDAGLLALTSQGRHRYYRLASPAVAATLEQMMALSGELAGVRAGARPVDTGPRDRAMRRARLCYDHLAGEVAVGIADAMSARGQLDFAQDGGALTPAGVELLTTLGVEMDSASPSRGAFCRPCLDWSERRPHIGGTVGRLLYRAFEQKGWVRRANSGRAVAVTPVGAAALDRHFALPATPSG